MQYSRMPLRQYYSKEVVEEEVTEFLNHGFVQAKIAEVFECSQSIVSYFRKKFSATDSAPNHKRYGRPRVTKQRNKMTEDDRRYSFEKYKMFKTN